MGLLQFLIPLPELFDCFLLLRQPLLHLLMALQRLFDASKVFHARLEVLLERFYVVEHRLDVRNCHLLSRRHLAFDGFLLMQLFSIFGLVPKLLRDWYL